MSNRIITATSPATLAACCALLLSCGDERETNPFDATGESAGTDSTASDSGPTSDSAGTDSAGSGTSGTSSTSGTSDGSTGGIKFDTPSGDTDSAGDGGGENCNCGNADWSYIFIANTQEQTVSKINTRTLQEEGRYATGGVSPSRTSVSIDGNAFVVANRGVGIAKYFTRPDLCDPNQNGTPGLQTSTDSNALPFGDDDCLDWFLDFPDMTVQRPVQWTPGEGKCHTNQKVWTTTGAGGNSPTLCGPQGVWVHLIDGDTGTVDDTVHIPENEFNCDHTNTNQGIGLGPYGGAVDADGNFWFHGWGNSKLVRMDFVTHDYEIFSGYGYGITVDTKGRVWNSSSIRRFDYDTMQSDSANVSTSGGIAQDLQGRIWAAGQNGVVFVDMETLAVGQNVSLPVTNQVKGVSVDIDGYIWAVAQNDTRAFKIDPDTFDYEIFDGLNGPYTYSDMTGGAVYNVTCNPEG